MSSASPTFSMCCGEIERKTVAGEEKQLPIYLIRDLEQPQVLVKPLHLRILEALARQPMTIITKPSPDPSPSTAPFSG